MIHSAQLQVSERKKSNYACELIDNYKRNVMCSFTAIAAIAAVATVLMCIFAIVPNLSLIHI